MFKNVRTKVDFNNLSKKNQDIYKNILAGACTKQKEENNQVIDYYDYSVLKRFGLEGKDVVLPDLKTIDINIALKIEEYKIIKLEEIREAGEKAIVSGFYSSALGSECFYYSTIAEQSTLNSLINLGVDNSFKAQEITTDTGGKVKGNRRQYSHTLEQLRTVLASGATHIGTQVSRKDTLVEQIENATTIEEIAAISWEVS